MSETPPGWHPQADGRERYWDGTQWTDQFRPAQGPPPEYPAAPPAKKSHTLRNVLLVIAGIMVLGIGGCTVATVAFVNEVDKAIEESDNEVGGPNNPMEIAEGEAFEVRGFEYAAGWTVGKDMVGDVDIKGLKVTNNRDRSDSALVEIKFWTGTEVLALADCTTEPIDVGTTVTLSCFSADDLPKSYDRITISDTF